MKVLGTFAISAISALLLGSSLATAAEPQPRIVNGTAAKETDYRWFVTVMSGDGQCGGSLIHPRWVLTAAHCFEPNQAASSVEVIAGRHKLSDTANGQALTALNIHVHPEFDSTSMDNDIALIELAEDVNAPIVKLSGTAIPLSTGTPAHGIGRGALAAPTNYFSQHYNLLTNCDKDLAGCIDEVRQQGESETAIIATFLLANGLDDERKGVGYTDLCTQSRLDCADQPNIDQLISAFRGQGKTIVNMAETIIDSTAGSDEVREVTLPLIDNVSCSDSTSFTLTDNMFCAGYSGLPKDTCQGDSGGPLVVRNSQGVDWQVGIVSYGGTCATNYGIYAKVANYLDWIEQMGVPHFKYERMFNWGEAIAAALLKPAGDEASNLYPATTTSYYARYYPASGYAVGIDTTTQKLYFFDGSLLPLNADELLTLSKAQGY